TRIVLSCFEQRPNLLLRNTIRDKHLQSVMKLEIIDYGVKNGRSQSTRNIKKQKFLSAPIVFERRAERIQREHVKSNVHYIQMHKHARNGLPALKCRIFKIKQRKQLTCRVTNPH